MPMKSTGEATDFVEIDRWDGGVGWLAHPEETMQRASHALAVDGDVWVVDPVDADGIDDLFSEFGTVAGVVVTLDRHARDAAEIAARHGVSVHMPNWVAKATDVDAEVVMFDGELADTGYRAVSVFDKPGWHEAALYDEETGTLLVGDALGTASYFTTGAERLGVHPTLRLFPPRVLGRFRPERVLVGHGAGVLTDASEALADALAGSRRRAPRLYFETLREFLSG